MPLVEFPLGSTHNIIKLLHSNGMNCMNSHTITGLSRQFISYWTNKTTQVTTLYTVILVKILDISVLIKLEVNYMDLINHMYCGRYC